MTFQHKLTILPIFHKPLQTQLNSHHNSTIMDTHSIIHQQQHLITTTSIDHEIINKPTTTISHHTNFAQNQYVS